MPPKKVLAKTKPEPKKRSRSATGAEKPAAKAAKTEEDKSASSKVKATATAAKKTASTTSAVAATQQRSVYRAVPERGNYTVVDDRSFVLNQTNVGENNNKYYIGQMLTNAAKSKYYVFFEWGRVGAASPQSSFLQNLTLQEAVSQFESKFRDKTGNAWSSRTNFVKRDGKYQIVETEESGAGGQQQSGSQEDASLPLGKLTKKQLEQGLEALEELEKILEQIEKVPKKAASFEDELVRLSSRFFSLIPTDIGRTNTKNLIIRDSQTLQERKEKIKFWLRMGLDGVEDVDDSSSKKKSADAKPLTPISGILTTPLPATLKEALPKEQIASSVTVGAKHEKSQTGKPSSYMSKELYAAICLYTGSFYSGINQVLRDANRDKILPYFKYLRMLFEACQRLKFHQTTLWRGIGVDLSSQYKVGDTIVWWSISSVTSAKSVAEGFMSAWSGGCTFCTVEAKTAVDISCISFIPGEKEYLLLPGTQLKVKKAEKKGKVFHVTLEEVGRLVS